MGFFQDFLGYAIRFLMEFLLHVQGMSDLLSPILYVMEDESESFWCFAALMERMAPNFHRDQSGMQAQLLALSKVHLRPSHLSPLNLCFI